VTATLDAPRPTEPPRPPSWQQTPDVPTRPPGRWNHLALAAFIALVGPVIQTIGVPPHQTFLMLLVGVPAVTAMIAMPARAWYLRAVVAVGAGAVLLPLAGKLLAVWMVFGLLLGLWVAAERPPLPFIPRPGPGAAGPVAVLCAVAGWQGIRIGSALPIIVPLALAVLVPFVATLGNGTLERIGARVGHVVGEAVTVVAFWLLGVLVVVLPWGFQRVLRRDPLRQTSGWGRRDRLDAQPRQPWAPDPHPRRRSLVPIVATLVVGAVGIGALLVVRARSAPPELTGIDQALRTPPVDPTPPGDWYPEYREDVDWALSDRVALVPFETQRLLNVRTRHVNIEDGRRVSWTPEGTTEPLRIWLYGGNAAFGFEQRDEHTIASELTRVAADNGVDVVVSNRGVPGQLHWRGSQRFAQDLATLEFTGEEKPDLVIFYDGFEDVTTSQQLVDRDLGDVLAPYEAYGEQTFDRVVNRGEGGTPTPDGVTNGGWPTVPGPAAADAGELAVRRYDRARRSTVDRARVAGIPVVFVWGAARTNGSQLATDLGRASTLLPDDIVDLTHALDAQPESFVDDVHHDEAGARAIASTLFDTLRPQLDQLEAARP
jgi:lysophospholipase L1-like esterase